MESYRILQVCLAVNVGGHSDILHTENIGYIPIHPLRCGHDGHDRLPASVSSSDFTYHKMSQLQVQVSIHAACPIGKYFPIFPEYFPNISGYFPMKIPKTNYSSPSIDLRWSIRWSIWGFRRVVPSRPSKQCHPRAGVPCLPASVEINKIASNEFFVAWNEIYII